MVVLLMACASASAQTNVPQGSRFEASVGVGLLGGVAIGAQPANERAGGTGAPYRLFDSDTTLSSSPTFDARVGVAITRRVTLEGGAALAGPEVRTSVSGDAEGALAITAVEQIDQYIFDGGLVVRVDEWRFLGLVPFASAGAGYWRQLHEGQTLVETGHLFYAGGGVRRELWTRGQGFVHAVGFRADARLYVFSAVASLGDGSRRQGTVSGSVFVGF
jgi:hypothetical protein